jgi:threonine/homoserine/homoserine lactone efflux protein
MAAAVLRGFATSALNPKCPLLFFALLPQFVAHTAPWPVTAQLAVLVIVHVVSCGLVYRGGCAPRPGACCGRDREPRIVGRISGLAMITVALALVIEPAAAA